MPQKKLKSRPCDTQTKQKQKHISISKKQWSAMCFILLHSYIYRKSYFNPKSIWFPGFISRSSLNSPIYVVFILIGSLKLGLSKCFLKKGECAARLYSKFFQFKNYKVILGIVTNCKFSDKNASFCTASFLSRLQFSYFNFYLSLPIRSLQNKRKPYTTWFSHASKQTFVWQWRDPATWLQLQRNKRKKTTHMGCARGGCFILSTSRLKAWLTKIDLVTATTATATATTTTMLPPRVTRTARS